MRPSEEGVENKTIACLMHMENMVMGIAFGTAVTVFRNAVLKGYKGTYNHIKLENIENAQPKQFPVPGNRFAQVSTENFTKIPGMPVAYWVSESVLKTFERQSPASNYADFRHGMSTSDNNRFLRLWFEPSKENIGWETKSREDTHLVKWYHYLKGGDFRKWYGNQYYVVNWKDDGAEIKEISNIKYPYLKGNLDFVLGGQMYFFQRGYTWTSLSAGSLGMRKFGEGFLFDAKGQCFFIKDEVLGDFLLALYNSKVGDTYCKILSPTVDFNSGVLSKFPVIDFAKGKTQQIVKANCSLSKVDWDSFKTSWDFQCHPMI